MTAIFTPEVVQVVGAVIVGAVLIHVALTLFSSFRRRAHESDQRRVSLEGLQHRAAVWRVESGVERERAERSWSGYRKFQIRRKVREIDGVHSFYLTPHDGKPLPPYEPGQYLTFQLRIPDRPKPVVRCYSLSDGPGPPDRYRVTIKKVPPPPDKPDGNPGLSSTFFNDHLQEGDILDVMAPGGKFVLSAKKNTPVVLIGGGIGITPVLSMLHAICDSGLKRETWFFLGVRNRAEHLMKEHLENLERENENVRVYVCYSEPGPDDEPGRDYHHKGYAGVELLKQVLPSSNYEFYTCGPPPMMSMITKGLREWGVPENDIHFEASGAATVRKIETETTAEEASIEVDFVKSGKTLTWSSEFGDLLDFAEENGIVIDCGCRAGNCGTCITAIKSGEVVHITEPGTVPAEGSCLTCISVPKTNLSLDA